MRPGTHALVENYIGGRWVVGAGGEVVDLDPARPADVLATCRYADPSQVELALEAARAASAGWRATSIHERAAVLVGAAERLEGGADALAHTLVRELGRRRVDALAEVRRAAAILRYFATESQREEGDVYAGHRERERVLSLRRPLGVVALITPWNLPLAIPAWKLGPALVQGNTVIWKPASLGPLATAELMRALADAGLPPGVCNLVFATGADAEPLIRDRRVAACSFTGSTEVGSSLVALGSSAGKRMQAEMGGKNAAVVLVDADLELAAREIVSGAMGYAGQRCTATARAIVEAPVYRELLDRIAALTDGLRVGPPLDDSTDLGPLASAEQHGKLRDYFGMAIEDGGRMVAGGEAVDIDGGYFVRPTVVDDVTLNARVFREEVFGPLLAVLPAADPANALELANRGPYGLSGAIFTSDLDRALDAIDDFDVGVLHVNSETCGADPHVPFGGAKASGTAHREQGRMARDFYTEVKTVYLRPSHTVNHPGGDR